MGPGTVCRYCRDLVLPGAICVHVLFLLAGAWTTIAYPYSPTFDITQLLFGCMVAGAAMDAIINVVFTLRAMSLSSYIPLNTPAIMLVVEYLGLNLFAGMYFIVGSRMSTFVGVGVTMARESSDLFLALHLDNLPDFSPSAEPFFALHLAAKVLFNGFLFVGDFVENVQHRFPDYVKRIGQGGTAQTTLTFTLLWAAAIKCRLHFAVIFARKLRLPPGTSIFLRRYAPLSPRSVEADGQQLAQAMAAAEGGEERSGTGDRKLDAICVGVYLHVLPLLVGSVATVNLNTDSLTYSLVDRVSAYAMVLGSTVNALLNFAIMRGRCPLSVRSLQSVKGLTMIAEWLCLMGWTYIFYLLDLGPRTLLRAGVNALQTTSQLALCLCLDSLTSLPPHLAVHFAGITAFNASLVVGDFAYNFKHRLPRQVEGTTSLVMLAMFTLLWAMVIKYRLDMAYRFARKLLAPELSVMRVVYDTVPQARACEDRPA